MNEFAVCPQLKATPEFATIHGKVPLRTPCLISLILLFSFFYYALFCCWCFFVMHALYYLSIFWVFNSSSKQGLTHFIQWCLNYFSLYLAAIEGTV